MSTSRIRKEVDEALLGFVDRQRPALLAISDDLGPLLSALDALLGGGKRLRPAFCYWGGAPRAARTAPASWPPPRPWSCSRRARWSTTT